MLTLVAENAEILQTYRDRLPHRPYCMSEKDSYQQIRGFDKAITEPYIQHNTPAEKHALVFDLDLGWDFDSEGRPLEGSTYAWERADLPPPNFICRNPVNGNCHYYYELNAPIVRGEKGRSHPQEYFTAIERAYQRQLKADIGYVGHISKNPFHPHWETVVFRNEPYELGELADYVELERSSRYQHEDDAAGYGRNTTLFNNLRQWAYSEVSKARSSVSLDHWHKEVFRQAQQYNATFTFPLGFNEVKATAKSIAKWTWYFYTGEKKASPLNLDPSLPIDVRQRKAAEYTAKKKAAERTSEIIAAIGILRAQGKRISKTSVAKCVGISRQHLSLKYSKCYEDALHNKNVNLATTSDNSALEAKHELADPKGRHFSSTKVRRGGSFCDQHPLRAAIAAAPRTLITLVSDRLSLKGFVSVDDLWEGLPAVSRSSRVLRAILRGIKEYRLYSLVSVESTRLSLIPVNQDDERLLSLMKFDCLEGNWSLKIPSSIQTLVSDVLNSITQCNEHIAQHINAAVSHVEMSRLAHVNLNMDAYRKGIECEARQSLQGHWGNQIEVFLDDNLYEYGVKFPYDEAKVYALSRLSDRRYDRVLKVWYVPIWLYHDLHKLLTQYI